MQSLKTLIFILLMATAMTITAQRNDDFFTVGDEFVENRDNFDFFGITIGGMNYETDTPLGSGLLVLVAAGAGYAVVRRKRSRRMLLALALLVGMTQCKKKDVAIIPEKDTIFVTLNTGYSRTEFDPNGPCFNWSADVEYIGVGGSQSGYLGELSGVGEGNDAAANRVQFSGTIAAPEESEDLYFFYLGNGSHLCVVGAESTTIDYSDQSAIGDDETKITNYLVAISRGDLIPDGAGGYKASANLQVKTSIAYFTMSGFGDSEDIYMHGRDVFSSVTINFKTGEVAGSSKGVINVGRNGAKYVALIPSTDSPELTSIKFDSRSKTSKVTFETGIMSGKFYTGNVETHDPMQVSANAVSDGALSGLFSVAPGKLVRFSKGNLQCTRQDLSTPWSEGVWGFLTDDCPVVEQNEFEGNTLIQENVIDVNYANKTTISLFGWGCTGSRDKQHGNNEEYYLLNSTSYGNEYNSAAMMANAAQYGPTGSFALSVENHSDWGWCFGGEESSWRSLTMAEWWYLLGLDGKERKASTVCGVKDARYTRAKINNVYGMIVFPDNYNHPDNGPDLTAGYINYQGGNQSFSDNNVDVIEDVDKWNAMKAAGAIFLPAAGARDEGDVFNVQHGGFYWTSTNVGECSAYHFDFDAGFISKSPNMRFEGFSVRLVYDAN